MTGRWFRLYDGVLDDPKVQRLPSDLFKAWIGFLCVASRHDGALPPMEDVAFALRTEVNVAQSWHDELVSRRLVDVGNDGVSRPHNWGGRQFRSDGDPTAAERQRRKRGRDRGTGVTEPSRVTSRPPEQNRTETDQSLSLVAAAAATGEVSSRKGKTRHVSYSAEFEAFWVGYPRDAGMSKSDAFKAWGKLSPSDQAAATAALPGFKTWIAKQFEGYRTLHACRFLTQRRFDGFNEQQVQPIATRDQVLVRCGTPAWDRWQAHMKKTTGKGTPRSERDDGWWFPSKLPPDSPTEKSQLDAT